MTIDDIIEGVLKAEGGYVNDPRDAGGETNWGITVATARANGWSGPMRELPRQKAKEIYINRYVVAPGFDKVAAINALIGAELVDTGVNMGPGVASKFLQRLLNGLNNQGKLYADIGADGDIGSKTLGALNAFLVARKAEGVKVLLAGLNALQGARYVELAEARQANEAFLYGWLLNRVTG